MERGHPHAGPPTGGDDRPELTHLQFRGPLNFQANVAYREDPPGTASKSRAPRAAAAHGERPGPQGHRLQHKASSDSKHLGDASREKQQLKRQKLQELKQERRSKRLEKEAENRAKERQRIKNWREEENEGSFPRRGGGVGTRRTVNSVRTKRWRSYEQRSGKSR